MKYQHDHYISPHLFVLNDQKYIIPGWVPVPMETTYDDIEWTNKLIQDKQSESEKKGLDTQE